MSSNFEKPSNLAQADISEEPIYVARTRNLTGGSGADLGFIIFEQLHVVPDQFISNELLANCFGELAKEITVSTQNNSHFATVLISTSLKCDAAI